MRSIVNVPMHRISIGDQVMITDCWCVVLDKQFVGYHELSNEHLVRLKIATIDERSLRLTYEAHPLETIKRFEIDLSSWI